MAAAAAAAAAAAVVVALPQGSSRRSQQRRRAQSNGKASSQQRIAICQAADVKFSSPKTGAVGIERHKEKAEPGTYWGEQGAGGDVVSVTFDNGADQVQITAEVGENLLRVAERAGVFYANDDFCFEGSCNLCEMEVEGGAQEVGYRAMGTNELVRSCLCPVPRDRQKVQVNLINNEDVWGEDVV
eukprot:jgi/Chlat1/3664/Chrsp24S00801